MANTKSAKKRILVTKKKTLQNKAIKSRTKTAMKKALVAIEKNEASAKADAIQAQSAVDRAVTKGVMHKNTAARRKSRLARLVNKQTA